MNKFLVAGTMYVLANIILGAVFAPLEPRLYELLSPEGYQAHHVWVTFLWAGSFAIAVVATSIGAFIKGGVCRGIAITAWVLFAAWLFYEAATAPPC